MELAKIKFDARRIAKGTRLLKEATGRAAALDGLAVIPEAQSAVQHSAMVSDLRAVYGLGGIHRANSAAQWS